MVCALVLVIPQAAVAQRREVHGVVLDHEGRAIRAAGVKLNDLRPLEIRSYITDGDGAYHFATLNPDIDYQVQAVFDGRSSEVRILERFASAPDVTVNLRIDLRVPRP